MRGLFLATLVVALAASGFSVYSVVRLLDRRHDLVREIHPAEVDTVRLLAALVDEETGIRGYVLTGDRSFLDPYQRGLGLESASLRTVTDAAEGRPAVAAATAEVRRTVQDWHIRYAEPTLTAAESAGAAPQDERALAAGKQLFDDVRKSLDGLTEVLRHERELAQQSLDRATVLLGAALGLLSVVTVAGGLLVWRLYRRSIELPLLALAADAAEVEAGRLDRAIGETGPTEIAALAASIEAMRSRIVDELTVVTEARAEVEEQRLALQRSNRDLEQFAYVASHDLQEPLRKVASFCQLLQNRYQGQLDEQADRYIEFAVDGAKRMQVLINDLLSFSRVGRQTDSRGPVDTQAALRQALDNLAGAVEETGAEVTAAPLPVVFGETSLLVALFQNLVGNAIKFRRPDTAPVVHVSVDQRGSQWLFAVRDDGIGIEAEYADRVFEIFKRLHAKTEYEGTGIGLAMCRKIVDSLGGEIWVDTGVTDGARICFTLNRALEPA
jgi:signal transduction histidine kinase